MGIDREELNAVVKEAVKTAVTEAFQSSSQTFFQEASKTFAQEMAKSAAEIRNATSHLAAILQRYVEEEEDEDDESDEESTFERSMESKDRTSTPILSGRRRGESEIRETQPKEAARQLMPSAPYLKEEATTYLITLPPTTIKINKGKTE